MTEGTVELERIRVGFGLRKRFPFLIAVCMAIVGIVVICAITGSLLAPQDPNAQNVILGVSPPGPGHPLGTDQLGRDVLSRLIAGARTAMVGPLIIALGAMIFGNALGLIAGYRGGAVEGIIMRWVDFMVCLPVLLIAIVVVGTLGGSYALAVVILMVLQIPYDTRIIRGATLEQRSLPYVEAARALGLPSWRIMGRAHLAQPVAARHRQHLPQLRLRPGQSRRAVVPGARCRAGYARLGPDAQRQSNPDLPESVVGTRARAGHRAVGRQHEHPRGLAV